MMLDRLREIVTQYPELGLYLAVAIGYLIGSIKMGSFSLGPVTGSLLTGILLSQFVPIEIPQTTRSIFFLLFLFGIGYSVGPQFIHALQGAGARIALIGLIVPVTGLVVAYVVAQILGLDPGFAAGLMSGALTESPAIGTATEAIRHLPLPAAERDTLVGHIVVADAVCYLFGAFGVIWMCSNLGPRLLGIDVKVESEKLEAQLGIQRVKPNEVKAARRFDMRTYRVAQQSAAVGRTVEEVESWLRESRTFVHRIRRGEKTMDVEPKTKILAGDVLAVSGRRETLIQIAGPSLHEVHDRDLADIPIAGVDIFATCKESIDRPLGELAATASDNFRGIYLTKIARLGPNGRQEIPVGTNVRMQYGDMLTLVGPEHSLDRAALKLGRIIVPSDATDYIVMGLAIFIGGLLGAVLAIPVGDMRIALSTSVGTLLAGLLVGHLHVSRPTFGRIPTAVVSLMTSFGLAAFVAIIGLHAGPVFFEALQREGIGLFFGGVVVTMVPQLTGLFVGHYILRINPILLLGALAGAQTMTAGLAALQEKSGSTVAVIGYTAAVPFGHILLTVWGTVIVWMMAS